MMCDVTLFCLFFLLCGHERSALPMLTRNSRWKLNQCPYAAREFPRFRWTVDHDLPYWYCLFNGIQNLVSKFTLCMLKVSLTSFFLSLGAPPGQLCLSAGVASL